MPFDDPLFWRMMALSLFGFIALMLGAQIILG